MTRLTHALLVLATGAACHACGGDSRAAAPLSPSAPAAFGRPSPLFTISGTVWEHAPGGVRPLAGGRLGGWHDTGSSGTTLGWIEVDAEGHYRLQAGGPATVSLYGGGGGLLQPCTAIVPVGGEAVSHDLHLVSDPAQVGARVPAALLAQGVLLSGTVHDVTGGRPAPVAGAHVYLDGLGGMGVPIARTVTDGDGRYVLCGPSLSDAPAIHVSAPGFIPFEADGAALRPGATLDVDLQRQ
jgi:hypothetical protein